MFDISGLDSIRTSQTTKVRSIPKSNKSKHLGIFMLNNEKNRLERERKALEKRLVKNKNRLTEIDHEIEMLENDLNMTVENVEIPTGSPKKKNKKWKTMEIDY